MLATTLALGVGATALAWLVAMVSYWYAVRSAPDFAAPPFDVVSSSAAWGLEVAAVGVLTWLATRTARVRGRATVWWPLLLGLAAVLTCTALTFRQTDDASSVLPWLGPVEPRRPSIPAPLTVVHPAMALPLGVMAALALSAVLAARTVDPEQRTRPAGASRTSRLVAGALTGPLTLALLAAAGVALASAEARSGVPVLDLSAVRDPLQAVPMAAAVLLVATAAYTSGERAWQPAVLTGVWLVFWHDVASRWWDGGSYVLLGAALASLAAVLVASSWRPLARGLDRLTA